MKIIIFVILYLSATFIDSSFVEVDSNGYILYCPCMGRFGNQADHFLGVLAFAKGLNRTLVLPPWVEYQPGHSVSMQVPFDKYFKVAPLLKYHRVLTMHYFMEHLAPTVWPVSKRIVLCYMARHKSDGCDAKEGNPFGPFWDTFGVDFIASSFYSPLSYDVHYSDQSKDWSRRYPPQQWPVLAFTGAPASFPVQFENRVLQEYLEWSDELTAAANAVLKTFPKGPMVGLHLRNGVDWDRACVHVEQSPNLFAGPQCLGYRNEHGSATKDLCLPQFSTIIKQTKRAVKATGAATVFVASDNNHMIDQLQSSLAKMQVSVVRSRDGAPHVDLFILARSNHFIGNCISSFSAFVKRHRDVIGFPSTFWAFPVHIKKEHNEL